MAPRWADLDGEQRTVSAMAGHYDTGFTLRTYTHTVRQRQDEAAQAMGNLIAQVQ